MSVYYKQANGRGRYEEITFVGGTKISKGAMALWRQNARNQWDRDGKPDRDADPSNPYWALQTYSTLVVARTVSELERLIESATYSSWSGRYRSRRHGTEVQKRYASYYVSYSNGRQAKALDRVLERLESVLEHVRAVIERDGKTPYGMDCDGNFVGYRAANESNKADEALAELMSLGFENG